MVNGYKTTAGSAHPHAMDEQFDTSGLDGEQVTLDVPPLLPLDLVVLDGAPLVEGVGPGQFSVAGSVVTLHGPHAATTRGLRVAYRVKESTFIPQGGGGGPQAVVVVGPLPLPVADGHPDPQTNGLTNAELRLTPVPVSGPLTAAELAAAGLALDGSDGAAPPAIPGTGIRGWLRSIYDKLEAVRALLAGTLTVTGSVGVTGEVEVKNDAGNPIPVSGTVTANQGTPGAQSWKVVEDNSAGIKTGTDRIPADPAREGGNLATLTAKDFALEGAPITGQALEAGGSKVEGWLSSVRKAITDRLPAALVGGRLDTNVGAWLGSTVPTVGQKAMANSLPVALASDQGDIGVAEKPGTAWTAKSAAMVNNAWTQLATVAAVRGVVLWVEDDQTDYVRVATSNDPAAGNEVRLWPGRSLRLPVSNANLIFVRSNTGTQRVSYAVV